MLHYTNETILEHYKLILREIKRKNFYGKNYMQGNGRSTTEMFLRVRPWVVHDLQCSSLDDRFIEARATPRPYNNRYIKREVGNIDTHLLARMYK